MTLPAKSHGRVPATGGSAPSSLRRRLQIAGLCLLVLYPVAVTTGYLCIRFGLDNPGIGFADVALLRWREVRRGFATRQFDEARKAWEAQQLQAANLAFASGLRNDPDNQAGRLEAARFLVQAGAIPMAISTLEEGFNRDPGDRTMAEQLFTLLLSMGRDTQALELLRRLPSNLPSAQLLFLRGCEVQATLNVEGPLAARKLLQLHPELERAEAVAPVIAKVWWESRERLKAIEMLAGHLARGAANYPAYAELTGWYLATGMPHEAEKIIAEACGKFPRDLAPRLLRLGVIAERSFQGREWGQELQQFVTDFRGEPAALVQLAQLAGRSGWIDLARTLYELSATRQRDLQLFALAYCDALAVRLRFNDALDVLAEIEAQLPAGATLLLPQVRNRQVLYAGAIGDVARTRDFARRLATTLSSDPQQLEFVRRLFEKRGLKEALAELPSPRR